MLVNAIAAIRELFESSGSYSLVRHKWLRENARDLTNCELFLQCVYLVEFDDSGLPYVCLSSCHQPCSPNLRRLADGLTHG